MTTKVQIGTIIHATLRPQDLIPAFIEELKRLDRRKLVSIFENEEREVGHLLLGTMGIDEDHEWWDSEDCACLLNETLFDALNEYAPVGCYFGAHFGDGSDFGFWPHESLGDAAMDDAVLCIGPKDTCPDYILETNDHGNVTMYRVELVEEWSCV